MEHMVLIAVNVVTVATQMGVILSPVTAAVLRAGQVKLAIPFVNLGVFVGLGFGGGIGRLLCFAIASVIALDLWLQTSK